MTSITKNYATYMFLMGTLFFNMSSFSGGQEVQSLDLSSSAKIKRAVEDCDIVNGLKENKEVECVVRHRKQERVVKIKKVVRQNDQSSDQSEELVIESECMTGKCRNGKRVQQVTGMRAITGKVVKTFADEFEELERLAKIEKDLHECKIREVKDSEDVDSDDDQDVASSDDEGNEDVSDEDLSDDDSRSVANKDAEYVEITDAREKLKCLTGQLAHLKGLKAENYYNDHIRPGLEHMLRQNSINDRRLAMKTLMDIGKSKNITCENRPKMQQSQNPLLNQENLNMQMGSGRMEYGQTIQKEKSFMKSSACDLWAFGTYNHNLQFLDSAAKRASTEQEKRAIQHAAATLKSGWGQYFHDRDLEVQSNLGGQFGMTDLLGPSLEENKERLDKSLAEIVERHKELLAPANQEKWHPRVDRFGRGSAPIYPQNTNGGGQAVTTTPWSQTPGQQPQSVGPGGVPQMIPNGKTNCRPGQAPRRDAPVGQC